MKDAIELYRQRIPRRLLLLDAGGALLAAVGILDLLGTGPRLVPDVLRFPGIGIAFIVAGSLVMLAVPVWLLRAHRHQHGHARRSPPA